MTRCMPGNRCDSAVAVVQGLDSASADDKLARRDEVSRHGCPHDAQDAGAGRAAFSAYGPHLCCHTYASYCAPCCESQRVTSYVGPTWLVALILWLHCSLDSLTPPTDRVGHTVLGCSFYSCVCMLRAGCLNARRADSHRMATRVSVVCVLWIAA